MRGNAWGAIFAAMGALCMLGCETGSGDCGDGNCRAPAPFCEGDAAVQYTGDGVCNANSLCDYGAVETRTDCTVTGQVCRNGACAAPLPCENVTCDGPPEPFCEGAVAVSYAATGTCDAQTGACSYAESRTGCTGGLICLEGSCQEPGLCHEVVCETPPGPACEVDDLVVFAAVGTCNPADGTCAYADASRVDCSADGGVCLDAACVNECVDVVCESPPEAACDGNVVVSHAAEGTCDPVTGACAYEETRTDCLEDQICARGVCVPASTVMAGDLVLTEVMLEPYIADHLGEWFEVHNTTDRLLDLTGLTFTEDPSDTTGLAEHFTIPEEAQLTLEPGGYLVLGPNCIPRSIGRGILDWWYGTCDETTTPPTIDTPMMLDGADRLAILGADGLTVIDDVAWDGGPEFPRPFSASMQLADDPATEEDGPANVDNALGEYWCPARSVYHSDAREFRGTPGAPNEACLPPVTVTIYQIQDLAAAGHPEPQTLVRLERVALTWQYPPFLWIQELQRGPYSGINIDGMGMETGSQDLERGDLVDVEGYYEEYYGATILKLTSFQARPGEHQWIAPEILDVSVLDSAATAEPWEQVLVEVQNVGILSEPDALGMTYIGRNLRTGPLLVPQYEFDAQRCDFFPFIRGLLNYRSGGYELLPNGWHGSGTPLQETGTVQVLGSGFAPARICAPVASSVAWESQRGVDANLTGDFSLTVPAGGTASHWFAGTGTYGYTDGEGQAGSVVVHR